MNKGLFYVLLVILLAALSSLVSCSDKSERIKVAAKVKPTYTTVGNDVSILYVDQLVEPGDIIISQGIHYTILSIDRPANNKPWLYEVQLEDEGWITITQGERFVGKANISNTNLDTLFLKDNE